jgi:alkaline phosphatase D
MFCRQSFKTIIRKVTADALPDGDFTAKVLLDGLPAGRDIFIAYASTT